MSAGVKRLGLFLRHQMHALVATVLFGVSGLDTLDAKPQGAATIPRAWKGRIDAHRRGLKAAARSGK